VPHDPRLVTEDMVAGRLMDILLQWVPRSGIIQATHVAV
jgi:hypothetical protein